ncbi:GDP-mannose mannosyl hydrolase [Noviherbaspirillum sp. UKPF54]|uniref:GDP-mannose mannosyl hydrolase n=1 Tax=Noviherbaspirillum sp. UKPF54 TaxID=2601898 RepID=UPI0011B137E6|nr:GDP-mannose mannosyl hydrolase [Noviherbaspirillum sp. UKPF54]QDZ27190.1 GDP-mannose mannosyl hydrolase [Noviherbaspirillum sp. UKPF54]
MHVDKDTFLRVIEATPFVSIDLVIRNAAQQVLLGYRCNRPAQHYWFVPGGRIRKNERTQDALQRIAQAELGIAAGPGKLLGVFDHIYDDNYFGVAGIGTHYVVCAYQFEVDGDIVFRQDDQHARIKWWSVDELLASRDVHDNTKLYFRDVPGNGFRSGC